MRPHQIVRVNQCSKRSFSTNTARLRRKASAGRRLDGRGGRTNEWHNNQQIGTGARDWETVDSTPLEQKSLSQVDKDSIPRLAHGLEQVVKEESLLHPLRDLDTKEFNFTESLHKLKPLQDLDLSSIGAFIPPAGDSKLQSVGLENNCTVMGSTSSVTPLLSKLYLFLSNQRPCDLPVMSRAFEESTDKLVASLHRYFHPSNGSFDKIAMSDPRF